MHQLSMIQALSLWTDLESAYHNKNSYGGDTAEIYMYRFMSRCPSAESARSRRETPSILTGIIAESLQDQVRDANEAMCSLLQHFAKTREVHIEVNGKKLGDWLKTADFDHRVHVKVVHAR
jgi:hypothetical protein